MLSSRSSLPTIPGYQIERELGRGGMGVVYKARSDPLNRVVAVKMILAGEYAGVDAASRFLAEAGAVARLQHANIVQIYHVNEHAGHPFFEMEYVGGGSLADQLEGTPWPTSRAAELMETLALAMSEAHRKGIVHRDLKPGNILLTPEGDPKVADFGLAKLLDSESEITRSGVVLGSPSYMAPEQAEGNTKDVGPAADLHALGAMLYELLTGRPPFRGTSALETLHQVKTTEPVPPSRLVPGLPSDLETITLKCLQKDPHRRYATAGQLADDLMRFRSGEPVHARRISPLERGWRWCHRNPALAASLGALATLLGFFLGYQVMAVRRLEAEQGRTQAALEEYQRLSAVLALDEGQFLGEKGYENQAILWMARSIRLAPSEVGPYRPVARTNFEAWERRVHPLRMIFQRASGLLAEAFSPDGRTAIISTKDHAIKRWELGTGLSIGQPQEAPPADDRWTAAAFNPGGELLLIGSGSGQVELLDTASGSKRWGLSTGESVLGAAISSDGKLVGLVCERIPQAGRATGPPPKESVVRLLNSTDGRAISPPITCQGLAVALGFSPDASCVVVASGKPAIVDAKGILSVYDLKGQPVGNPIELPTVALAVAFSPDGRTIMTGHWDYTARLWSRDSGKNLLTLQHEGPVRDVRFSVRGTTLLTGSLDGTVRLWEGSTGRPLGPPLRHQGRVALVAYSKDGQRVLSGDLEGTTRLWGVASQGNTPGGETKESRPYPLALSTHGDMVLVEEADGRYRARDTRLDQPIGQALGAESPVQGAAISADGEIAAIIERIDAISVFKIQTAERILQLTHPGKVVGVAISPDGATIAGQWVGGVRLWSAKSGKLVAELRGPAAEPCFAMTFSPDSKSILTGGPDGAVQRWETATGRPLGEAIRHYTTVFAVAFSPDGRSVLTGGNDNTARLWDAVTGKALGRPMEHDATVYDVAFSPDAKMIVTGSRDHIVRLWDAATGKPLGPPMLHPGPVRSVVFWWDGSTILVGYGPIGSTDLSPLTDLHARSWPVPSSISGEPDRLELYAQVITGMELQSDGGIKVLDADIWQARQKALAEVGANDVIQ
jgi:WD40 repeat protein